MLNSAVNQEIGTAPFTLLYGTELSSHCVLPLTIADHSQVQNFVRELDLNLKALLTRANQFVEAAIQVRTQDQVNAILALQRSARSKVEKAYRSSASELAYPNIASDHIFQRFQPTDLVFFDKNRQQGHSVDKFTGLIGPYEVIVQERNTVSVKDIITGTHLKLDAPFLSMYSGAFEDAYKLALADKDQYVVSCIVNHYGNPLKRTTMTFKVVFENGDVVWQGYSKDLDQTIAFEEYCRSVKYLLPLLDPSNKANTRISNINKHPITEVKPGSISYVDLEAFGTDWFLALKFPWDKNNRRYVLAYKYRPFNNPSHKKINMYSQLLDEDIVDAEHYFVYSYGCVQIFDPLKMILVDDQFALQHPQIFSADRQQELIARCHTRLHGQACHQISSITFGSSRQSFNMIDYIDEDEHEHFLEQPRDLTLPWVDYSPPWIHRHRPDSASLGLYGCNRRFAYEVAIRDYWSRPQSGIGLRTLWRFQACHFCP
jgi:hypothetical protein